MRVEDSLGEDDECRTHRRKRVCESQSECREGRRVGGGKGQERGACWTSSLLAVGVGWSRGRHRGGVEGEKGEREWGWGGGGIVTRELKVLLRSSLSPSNLHWS